MLVGTPPARLLLWVLTLAVLAVSMHAVLHPEAASAVFLCVAFGAYVTYVIAGVMFPSLQMHADVTVRLRDPGVALTFDDGPHPETTREVLRHLRERGMTATFFLIGRKVERHPEVVREIIDQGHEVALHTYDHDRVYPFKSPAAVVADIRRTQRAIQQACGRTPTWFRPPVGMTSPRTAQGTRRAGVRIVAWSARGLDGIRHGAGASLLPRLYRGLRPGAIVLLHDASERDDFTPPSLAVLPEFLAEIERRGLVTKRLGDVLPPPALCRRASLMPAAFPAIGLGASPSERLQSRPYADG